MPANPSRSLKRPPGIKLLVSLQVVVAGISLLVGFGLVLLIMEFVTGIELLPKLVFELLLAIANFLSFIFADAPALFGPFSDVGLMGLAIIGLFLLATVVNTYLAWGLWRLKTWSWRSMKTIQFFSVMASFFGLFLDSGAYAQVYILNLAIALWLFAYFSRHEVKRAFKVQEPSFKI